MNDNWIITEQGDALNLNYVAKIMWGGDFPSATADQEKRVYIFHGGIAQVTGQKGATTCYEYASSLLAQTATNRFLHLLSVLGANGESDFRNVFVTLTSVSPAEVTAGVATEVTLTGSNLMVGGVITIGGVNMTIAAGLIFTTDVTIAAGTYDVLYTDERGYTVTLTNGITFV
jgi:hypothetical protein